jgi:hypothetical protein
MSVRMGGEHAAQQLSLLLLRAWRLWRRWHAVLLTCSGRLWHKLVSVRVGTGLLVVDPKAPLAEDSEGDRHLHTSSSDNRTREVSGGATDMIAVLAFFVPSIVKLHPHSHRRVGLRTHSPPEKRCG